MTEPIHLWLDDECPMPDGYNLHCRTAEQAIDAIKAGGVVEVSLDFFLGEAYTPGLVVAELIERGAKDGTIAKMRLRTHTGSAAAKWEMLACFRGAMTAWMADERRAVESTP